jgi:hypothetical protein
LLPFASLADRLGAHPPPARLVCRRHIPTSRNVWPELARGFVLAFALTAAPVFIHGLLPTFAILFCVLAAAAVSRWSERDVPVIVLTANVFSNVFISIASVNYTNFEQIEQLKVYSFITTIVCYLTVSVSFIQSHAAYSPFIRRLMVVSVGVIVVIGVYFLLGLAVNPRSSVIYLRNTALPILMFQTFLIVGVRRHIPVPQILFVLLSLVLGCAYLELLADNVWLYLTNGLQYFTLLSAKRMLNIEEIRTAAAQGAVINHPGDYMRVLLFNTTLTADLGIHIQRINGPNFNPISFAYLLSILLAFLALHGYAGITALATPLLLSTSAKGAMVLFLGALGFSWLARHLRGDAPVKALAIGLFVYAATVFQIGYSGGDFHILGLIGGVNGFLSLPIGHTLGDGGNHSIPDFSQLEWGAFQRSGAANVAVESAFGVMLYQMGVCVAVVIGFYLWIARTGWRFYKGTGLPAFAFATSAIAICLVNGLFQEDAYFVPLSLPVVMGLVGLTLGAADRESNRARMRPSSISPLSSSRPKEVM